MSLLLTCSSSPQSTSLPPLLHKSRCCILVRHRHRLLVTIQLVKLLPPLMLNVPHRCRTSSLSFPSPLFEMIKGQGALASACIRVGSIKTYLYGYDYNDAAGYKVYAWVRIVLCYLMVQERARKGRGIISTGWWRRSEHFPNSWLQASLDSNARWKLWSWNDNRCSLRIKVVREALWLVW